MSLTVVKPGLLTTVQDLGRPHAAASGVTPGGAMDRFAHSAANLLVGNDPAAATLECTISGPTLVAGSTCVVAVTGADLDARIDGEPAPAWTSFVVEAGSRLSFAGRRSGARAYIAVAGGIVADRWLGSMATDLLVGRGGTGGRALQPGDVVKTAGTEAPGPGRSLAAGLRPAYGAGVLGAIAGPQAGRLSAASRAALTGEAYTVGISSNRMGFRLDGPVLDAPGDELLSFNVIAGAVQLPAGGHPILLMADHQTAGGYPVVAVVIAASMPVAAQLAPGDRLRFEEVTVERALAMRAAQREALESLMSWM